ncbi:uncharacterized protein LOC34618658 [Cyclospora cayetanensis]|uniref:Uncharacterized protein LOC34618658 n=1 Tax=Cyclospora cayetanensis TaxID=88456 RepID=A0A6P6RQA4_9EIME|nr:uncharacterized protein LOC34618658 [Cyclospora cayetanensis]
MVFGVVIAAVGQPQPTFSIFFTPEGNDSQRSIRQQAIIRRVADDHSFQLQCIREGQHTASPSGLQSHTITGIAPGGPSGGSVVSGQVDVSSSTSSAASGTSTVNVLREADVKGSKRQWTSGTQGGISGTAPEDGVLEGLLMLQVSTLFSSPKLVLWKRVDEMLYMVVFEVTENCLLVSNFLTLFIHILADIFGVTADSPPLTNLYQKRPDALLVTLHYLLPGGQLLFTNIPRMQRIKADIKEALRQGAQGGKS